jgi:SAM-dependent methyltransferase
MSLKKSNDSVVWQDFAKDYDSKVFSLTSVPERRAQLISGLKGQRILNLGCGSTPYLNQNLIELGKTVYASDFCEDMLEESKKSYAHKNLRHILGDSRQLPFESEVFDSVLSSNSILPESRSEVVKILSECKRVLTKEGRLVAFLPAFDCGLYFKNEKGWSIKLDEERLREHDTIGWQCFHTPESIEKEFSLGGLNLVSLEKIFLNTPNEISQIRRIYNLDTSENPIWEYLAVGEKV